MSACDLQAAHIPPARDRRDKLSPHLSIIKNTPKKTDRFTNSHHVARTGSESHRINPHFCVEDTLVNTPVDVTKVTPAYWRVTFNNPPINLFDPETFAALRLLLNEAEASPELRVIVFDSANPHYYIAHLDVERTSGAIKLDDDWHNFVTRLAQSPAISIASIRGRARGIGSEFALACDMRFASREWALFTQSEVAAGVVPGGGALDWLPQLVGRSRALEIVLGCDDIDADTAERYGYINRALPEDQLDVFVDRFAGRIARSATHGISTAKRIVNERMAPPA